MPRDAYGPGIEVVTSQARGTGATGAGHPAGPASARPARPPVPRPRRPPPARPRRPGGPATGGSDPRRNLRRGSVGRVEAILPRRGASRPVPGTAGRSPTPYELSAASLLAAGVLAALGRRRREQLWRRAFGQRIAAPEGDAAVAESALRIGARRAVGPAARRRAPAPVPGAGRDGTRPCPPCSRRTSGRRTSICGWPRPIRSPPAPWTAADGGAVWRLPLAAVTEVALDGANRVARPLSRPGLDRHQRDRADPGRPGGRARADRGARAAPARSRRPWPRSPSSWPPTAGPTRCGSPWSASAPSWP